MSIKLFHLRLMTAASHMLLWSWLLLGNLPAYASETEEEPGLEAALEAAVEAEVPSEIIRQEAEVVAQPASQDQDALIPAENIDLSEPVITEEIPAPVSDAVTPSDEIEEPASQDLVSEQGVKEAETTPQSQILRPVDTPFVLLGKVISPGTTTRLSWEPDQQFEGIAVPTPVLVAHGAEPGPKLCLTAAIHGDELTGIEIVRRVLYEIDPKELHGSVIGVPIVNLQGFMRSSRYLADRRDLNRYFPGNRQGSSASRIANSFFRQVISHCDLLVDLHTGSFYRTNLPQLRADLSDPDVLKFSQAFDAIAVLHSGGASGTLRRAAVEAGIPAVTLEAGGPMELEEAHVSEGVKSINTLLDKLGMLDTLSFWGNPQPAIYKSVWVRANQGGILFSTIKLGALIKKGELLGTVTDPVTNVRSEVRSTVNGRILGMAVNQFVMPGFAAYHIGIDPAEAGSDVLSSGNDDSQDIDEEEESTADSFD